MEELKILKQGQIEINDSNYCLMNFLYAKATAILKLIDYFSSENDLSVNPFNIVKQEFSYTFNKEMISSEFMYDISIECLICACNYLTNNLKIKVNNLHEKIKM